MKCFKNPVLIVVLAFAIVAQAPLSVWAADPGGCQDGCQSTYANDILDCVEDRDSKIAAAVIARDTTKDSCGLTFALQSAAITAAFILCVAGCAPCVPGCITASTIAGTLATANLAACIAGANTVYQNEVNLQNNLYGNCVGRASDDRETCLQNCNGES